VVVRFLEGFGAEVQSQNESDETDYGARLVRQLINGRRRCEKKHTAYDQASCKESTGMDDFKTRIELREHATMEPVNHDEQGENYQNGDAYDAVVDKGEGVAAEVIEGATSTLGNMGGSVDHQASAWMAIVKMKRHAAGCSSKRSTNEPGQWPAEHFRCDSDEQGETNNEGRSIFFLCGHRLSHREVLVEVG
jgi:hypothetical protein